MTGNTFADFLKEFKDEDIDKIEEKKLKDEGEEQKDKEEKQLPHANIKITNCKKSNDGGDGLQNSEKIKIKINSLNKEKQLPNEENKDTSKNVAGKTAQVRDSPEEKAAQNIDEKLSLDEMFIRSETELKWKDRWIEIYNKAIESGKKTQTNKKIRNGLFRIGDGGKIEILPNHPTYNKSSKQLFNEKWSI